MVTKVLHNIHFYCETVRCNTVYRSELQLVDSLSVVRFFMVGRIYILCRLLYILVKRRLYG